MVMTASRVLIRRSLIQRLLLSGRLAWFDRWRFDLDHLTFAGTCARAVMAGYC